MILISLLAWAFFGILIGAISKLLTPGKDPSGWLTTMGIGIVGSYFGGIVKTLIFGLDGFSPAGIVFSVLGGIIFLLIWRKIGK